MLIKRYGIYLENKSKIQLMARKQTCLLILFIGMMVSGCTDYALLKDMAVVDQAYIRTSYFLAQENQQDAQQSLLNLQAAWQKLSTSSHQVQLSEEDLYKVAETNSLIRAAGRAMLDGDLYHTSCTLDDARYLMSDWRKRKGVTYYLDYLFAFHQQWKIIQQHLKEPTVCQLDWKAFQNAFNALEQDWRNLEKASVEWHLFEVLPYHKEQFENRKAELREAIVVLKKEADWACLENMIYQAGVVYQKLESLLDIFGNFKSIA